MNKGLVASWWTVVGISLVIMLMVLFACAIVGVVYLLITEPEVLQELFR